MTLRIPRIMERCRYKHGLAASRKVDGPNGLFDVPVTMLGFDVPGLMIRMQVSNGLGWEHVSVSICGRKTTPPWELMAAIKDFLWEPEDCVMQLHPPQNDYVNFHPGCLHLWRPLQADIPRPPSMMVGPKETPCAD